MVTTARVLIVGSAQAEDLLTPIAGRLVCSGVGASLHIGPLADLRQTQGWRSTDVLLTADSECARADIVAAPNLRAVVSPVLGVEGIDEPAATEAGVLVVRGQVPENYESMAEATLMLVLAASYDLPGKVVDFKVGIKRPKAELRSRMLKSKTIGIVGFGNIAKALITRLMGWKVRILVHSRRESGPEGGVEFVSLPELLGQSDVIVLLCDLNDDSRHLLNRETLAMLRSGAIVVNTARGGLIDEAALIDAVEKGKVSYLALDVFEREPLALDSRLRKLESVILTSHCIGHTEESIEAIRAKAVHNVLEVLRGKAPLPVRNPQILTAWTEKWRGQCLAAEVPSRGESADCGKTQLS